MKICVLTEQDENLNTKLMKAIGSLLMTKRPTLKVCLVGLQKPYPAFDSVSSILKDILGQKQVIELRIRTWLSSCPPLLKFSLYMFQDLILFLKIISCYKREKVNTILLFQCYYPLSSIILKLLKIKLLLFIGGSSFYSSYLEHTSTIGKVYAYINLPIQKFCHKFADVLITLSKNMVKMIGLENYDYKTWFALPRLDKNFFDKFGITKIYKERRNIIGFVGFLRRSKGVLGLIKAIPFITKRKNNCKFMLIGSGPLLETIKTEVQKLELSKSINITGWVDDHVYLKKCYNEMKLYVHPSYTEGIPSTIFEAMACGTPVLATPVGGIPDIIKDGENGFLLESNDPEHITDRITKLLDNTELLERVSANAYRYVRKNFNEKIVLESWRRIFQNIAMSVNGKIA